MKIFQSISSITSIIIILMMIVILTMTLKVIIENGNRLTSSCRFSPLLQLPTAVQLSYSHQTLMMVIIIALVMTAMMIVMITIIIVTKLVAVIINRSANLVSKADSKDGFRIRRSQKLFQLGHSRSTSLSINVNVKRWCTKRSKTKIQQLQRLLKKSEKNHLRVAWCKGAD